MTEPVFLIAPPRSGTNALRSALQSGSNCRSLGEIFHQNSRSGKHNYYYWRIGEFRKDPAISVPTEENIGALWHRYLEHLQSEVRENFAIIDVKYNSLRSLDHIWQPPMSRPYIFKFLIEKNSKVIHLWRRDLERLVVSLLVARETGNWVYQTVKHRDTTLRIDPKKFRSTYIEIRRNHQQVGKWLSRYGTVLNLYYEDLFDESGLLDGSATAVLAGFLGTEVRSVQHRVQKTPFDYAKSIENLSEIRTIAAELSALQPDVPA